MHVALDDKLQAAHNLLSEILKEYGPDKVAVAWTGGKDSTLVLHLWRAVLREANAPPAFAVNLDTGSKFPEILTFRDKWAEEWKLRLAVAQPDQVDIPMAEDTVACCQARKVEPLLQAIERFDVRVLLTGIRRDEHPDRSNRAQKELHSHPAHWRIHPIFEFTEMDVWAATVNALLPWCELYNQGYRSLGCMPCTVRTPDDASERAGRSGKKEALMANLTAMGYF